MTSLAQAPTRSWAPPRLTRDVADARTLLARGVRAIEVVLGDAAWRLTMEPLAGAAPTALGADDWLVRAQWDGAPFELRLPLTAADRWLRARFPALDLPQLPPAVRCAAVELALQEVLCACEGLGAEPPRVERIETSAPGIAPALGHHFALALTDGPVTLWATLSTDTLGLMLIARLAAHLPGTEGPLSDERTPVRLAAEIGTARLSRAELASLRPGDAIVLQHCWIDQEAQLWLRQGARGLRVRDDGTRLVVTEPFRSLEDAMDEADELDELDDLEDPDDLDDQDEVDELDEIDDLDDLERLVAGDDSVLHDAPADEAEALEDDEPSQEDDVQAAPGDAFCADDLDALPVQLRFDLGQRSLPLSALMQLQVGQVLELTRPLSQAVSIRANGALVGTGELIEIGGRLAVAVTALGRRAREPQ